MKLISINIESSRHLDRVLPFIQKEKPDVLCLQEADENMLNELETQGYNIGFAPIYITTVEGKYLEEGELIASKYPLDAKIFYYYKPEGEIPHYNEEDKRNHTAQVLVSATVTIDNDEYIFATTNFTWSPDGDNVTDNQILDLQTMREELATYQPHILCGDFNLPRGYNTLYPTLAEGYTDCIPEKY